MPGHVASRARATGSTPKRSQEHQHPPAKRPKLTQTPSSAQKRSIASVVIPRKSDGKKKTPNGFKDDVRLHQVDESSATIANGTQNRDVDMEDAPKEVVEISSGESENESEYDSDEVEAHAPNGVDAKEATNGTAHDNSNDDAEDSSEEEEGEKEPPTFGELLQASGALDSPIDVSAALDPSAVDQPLTKQHRALSLPPGATLSTVLTQALRTHDKDLLETCLQLNDLDAVRSTIERLASPLALNLLNRLAERLHKRPGRAATLMVWIQWTLVAHGGHLVAQKELSAKLADLHRVISERAQGLQPLLQLKGKLDMLSAQLELRRGMGGPPEVGADDDDAVIYVEGEESDSDEDDGNKTLGKRKRTAKKMELAQDDEDLVDDDADDGMEMPIVADSDDEQADSDEGVLDDEAEETDRDTGDDLSEAESEDEEDEDEGDFIDDGESIAESEEETSRVRRSTAVQRPSKKAF